MKKLIVVVLVLAAFLRLWKLGSVPPSASLDEASIGYNAYSVLKIGVDEYGEFPLISQRGYDDWRRSTYLFLVAPFVALFDMNVVAIRLPAVILSILTIWATYHIVLLLFSKRSSMIALLVPLLLAISPWHIYISRLGHESNAYLSFFVFGILFFLLGLKNKNRLFLSLFFFVLSMVSYYAGQVLIPLFGLGLVIIYRYELAKILLSDRRMLVASFVSILILMPIIWSIFSPAALVRFGATSTFNPDAHFQEIRKRRQQRISAIENNDIVGRILNSERLFPVQVFIESYSSHLRPTWLFTNSSSEPFKVPNMGLLYLWEFPFMLIGILALFFSRELDSKVKQLIFLWFLLAPLPASIATGAPHAMRSYAFLPTWQLFTSVGVFSFLNIFKSKLLKKIVVILLSCMIIFSAWNFYQKYMYDFPKLHSGSFQYALSQAIPYVKFREQEFDKVVFSNQDNLYQSYMFFLYYSRFDPLTYQASGGTRSGGYAQTHEFGKYEFRPIDWQNEERTSNTLYVGNADDFPPSTTDITSFQNLDGNVAIQLVE